MTGRRNNPIPTTPAQTPRSAFSLVEMVMVVVLLGVLAGVAAPRYAAFLREQRLNAAENRIRSDLALAQRRARYLQTAQTMRFHPGTHRYTLDGMTDPDKSGVYTVRLGEDPYGVTLVSADLGGDANLVFDAQGTPDTGGTIVIRLGSQTRTISFGTSVVPWTFKEPVEILPQIQ